MKKTLIALAALAATGAFAQSSVTLSGNLDVGVKTTSAPTNASGSASKNEINYNNVSTSALFFKGTEDIGGGLKAGFLLELDPNLTQSSTLSATTKQNQVYSGTPFNGEQYVTVGGGFGEVKLGTANAGALIANGIAQPYGTAMGGGFSSTFGRLGSAGLGINQTLAGPSSANRIVRHEKVVQYTTPTMSGFSGMFEYAFANDAVTGVGTSTTSTPANSEGFMGLTLKYANGPLNAIYSYTNAKVGGQSVPFATTAPGAGFVTSTAAIAGSDVTWQFLAANYTFGATTVYGGYTTTKHNAAAGQAVLEDASSWNIAAKYALSANVDLSANYLVRMTNVYAAAPANILGLGADYKLSKRSNLYARYERTDVNTGGTTTDGGSVATGFAVGVRHQF